MTQGIPVRQIALVSGNALNAPCGPNDTDAAAASARDAALSAQLAEDAASRAAVSASAAASSASAAASSASAAAASQTAAASSASAAAASEEQARIYSEQALLSFAVSNSGEVVANPRFLFAYGESGAWLDLSIDGDLYQDAAGTIPVTALLQPIGRINDRSPNSNDATQPTTTRRPFLPANGRRLRSDFTDDAMPVTIPGAPGEAWVNTAHGHYRTQHAGGPTLLPLNDCTAYVARSGSLTAEQRTNLAKYFGTPDRLAVFLSPDTTVTMQLPAPAGSPATVTFVGNNGVAVDKVWPVGAVNTTMDLSADGLIAPMAVCVHKNTALTQFQCQNNQLTGNIPSLSANTALTQFQCQNNQLTGSIPSLSANTALTQFWCHTNQLTGSIPSLSANTALTQFNCYANQLTGSIPSLSANTALTQFNCNNNQLTGSIPSLSANTALTQFICNNNQLTGWVGGTVPPTLGSFQAQINQLPATTVNALLAAFVAAGRTSAQGTCVLNLGGNAAPTGQGLTDKATLQARGWTVTTA